MKRLWKPALLLAAMAIMAFGMLNSGAWFTDQGTSATGHISSGTLSIDNGELSHVTLGTIANMAPGDKTGTMEIIIKNNGNINLAWFGNLVVEGDAKLKEAVYIDFAQMEFLSPTGKNWQAEDTDNFISEGKGAGAYPTAYNNVANLSPFGVITLNNFDGQNFMGVAPYEFDGALKPGYSYKLTLRFGMAEEAGNEYQHLGPLNVSFYTKATQISEGAIQAENPGSWSVPSLLTWLNNQIADQTEP